MRAEARPLARTMSPSRSPRRYQRHAADGRVVVNHEADGRSHSLHGRCNTLSLGGFGAVLAGNLDYGAVVSVELRFSGAAEPLRLRAQVRHARGFQHGFEFLGLSTTQLEGLRKVLRGLPLLTTK